MKVNPKCVDSHIFFQLISQYDFNTKWLGMSLNLSHKGSEYFHGLEWVTYRFQSRYITKVNQNFFTP